jgi:hypothetical protein
MAVIGPLKLVLDNHDPTICVCRLDIEPELADRHLRRSHG